jgi:Chaperone of endosialidase
MARSQWRIWTVLTLILGCLAVRHSARAACPEICDNSANTALGNNALPSTLGVANTAIGAGALSKDQSGVGNTAAGASALGNNQNGDDNTAIGINALIKNQSGFDNTATGTFTLSGNVTGSNNTATGSGALQNADADNNTAHGYQALLKDSTGSNNTATGAFALLNNKTAGVNTATGVDALFSNTIGSNNTANGGFALQNNTTASNNTAYGTSALFENTTGAKNTAAGVDALENNTKGGSNVAVGYLAGQNLTIGSNNIDIGANVTGVAGEANAIRIGKQGIQKSTFIAGIAGTPISGSTVVINSTGKLGVATSSARFKEAIKPMATASETILALKPVTFRYKEEVDPDVTPQFGLVAEDVEKVAPDLVVHDEQGKPFTVRYEAVNAMLLNEFLKEHHKVEVQEATIAELKKQVEALTTGLRRVGAAVAVQAGELRTAAAQP